MNIQAINLFFSYFSYSADFKKKKLDLPEITYKRYSISIISQFNKILWKKDEWLKKYCRKFEKNFEHTCWNLKKSYKSLKNFRDMKYEKNMVKLIFVEVCQINHL